VFWAAIPHQIIDYSGGTVYFVATIPLQCFLQWRLPEGFVQPFMQGQLLSEPTTARADSDALAFARWETELRPDAPDLERAALLEMQARLIRLARELSAGAKAPSGQSYLATISDTELSRAEQMACLIAQRYTEKLTAEQIGKLVKLHPNYAMTLFQKTFGMTLITCLTQHRVSHAQHLLVTTKQTATEIALKSGFQSLSRFNEAFRRACGCSPREYRKSHEALSGLVRAASGPGKGVA
jgi:AraC-like DNA-binding protein